MFVQRYARSLLFHSIPGIVTEFLYEVTILAPMLTVSPHRSNRGILIEITPETRGPVDIPIRILK